LDDSGRGELAVDREVRSLEVVSDGCRREGEKTESQKSLHGKLLSCNFCRDTLSLFPRIRMLCRPAAFGTIIRWLQDAAVTPICLAYHWSTMKARSILL